MYSEFSVVNILVIFVGVWAVVKFLANRALEAHQAGRELSSLQVRVGDHASGENVTGPVVILSPMWRERPWMVNCSRRMAFTLDLTAISILL